MTTSNITQRKEKYTTRDNTSSIKSEMLNQKNKNQPFNKKLSHRLVFAKRRLDAKKGIRHRVSREMLERYVGGGRYQN